MLYFIQLVSFIIFIVTYIKLNFILLKNEILLIKTSSKPYGYMVSSCKFILNFAHYNFTFDSI